MNTLPQLMNGVWPASGSKSFIFKLHKITTLMLCVNEMRKVLPVVGLSMLACLRQGALLLGTG